MYCGAAGNRPGQFYTTAANGIIGLGSFRAIIKLHQTDPNTQTRNVGFIYLVEVVTIVVVENGKKSVFGNIDPLTADPAARIIFIKRFPAVRVTPLRQRAGIRGKSITGTPAVSYTHLTLPTIYSV